MKKTVDVKEPSECPFRNDSPKCGEPKAPAKECLSETIFPDDCPIIE